MTLVHPTVAAMVAVSVAVASVVHVVFVLLVNPLLCLVCIFRLLFKY